MVGMCGRVVTFPNVPVSEHLYFYNLFHMKKYKHLYYCKNCMLNFETEKPAKSCTRCHQAEFIELFPKDFMKEDYSVFLEKLRFGKMKGIYRKPKMPKMAVPKSDLPRRAKIWFHYMTSKPQEELPSK